MSKMKTVLVVFVAVLLANNAFSQVRRSRGLPRPEASSAATQEQGQSGIPGVTAPFIPFDKKNKIKFDDAVERAKNNDAKAFYWLSYYFAKGECVDRDVDSAQKFLEKAVDANNPVACYTFGLLLENRVLQNEDGRSVGDRETGRGFENLHFFNLRPQRFRPQRFSLAQPLVAAWHTPFSWNEDRCLTNKVAIAHIESFYQKAVDGGLPYATNDIARLHRKVTECERRIVQKKIDQEKKKVDQGTRIANAEKAKALIRDPKETQAEECNKQQREFWSKWPNEIPNDALAKLVSGVERKFNCVFRPHNAFGIIHSHGRIESSTNTWFHANGKSLIINLDNGTFQKIDSEGRIVTWGFSENRTDLEEVRYLESEREKLLNSLRSDWAKERGMTLDEAVRKHQEWIDSCPVQPLRRPAGLIRPGLSRPGLNHEPVTRLAAEQAKKEREQARKDRELAAEERRAQLKQLMQIQEELRRQREEKIREQNNMK